MIITLTGLPGAGKTTLAKLLSEQMHLKWYSMGDIRGQMAAKHGMTIDEFNELGMKEDFTDKEVDAYQKNLGETEDNFVADGWMSWYFIPHAFKIFIDVNLDEGARRVFKERRHEKSKDEPEYTSLEETKKILQNRIENSRARYQKYYGVDYLNRTNYDLIIDTTSIDTLQAFKLISEAIQANNLTK